MKVSVIAGVGRRGQIGKNGVIPWECRADKKDFYMATKGCAMIAGGRTYDQLLPVIGQMMSLTNRSMFRWDNQDVSCSQTLRYIDKNTTHDHTWIIGGAFTYRLFHRYVNHQVVINVLNYDNPPEDDHLHTFFPLDLYGLTL